MTAPTDRTAGASPRRPAVPRQLSTAGADEPGPPTPACGPGSSPTPAAPAFARGHGAAGPDPVRGGAGGPDLGKGGPSVIGLDLSLTGTGVAHADGTTVCIRPPGKDLPRLRHIRAAAAVCAAGARLVLLEGPSFNSRDGYAHERAGLWWLVYDELTFMDLSIAVVPPASLKKYATGKGSATKPDMRMALYQRAGLDVRDDNQVDAWWLRAMGLDHLGHPAAVMPAINRAALDKVRWPIAPEGDK